MTERTIRTLAKELASVFYEEAGGDLFGQAPEDRARSKRFRASYPTLKHYLRGAAIAPDGRVVPQEPGWKYFVTLARARMVQMLQDKSLSQSIKDGIYKALIEENMKSTSPRAQELLQRRLQS